MTGTSVGAPEPPGPPTTGRTRGTDDRPSADGDAAFAALLARAQAGDGRAVAVLFRELQPRLLRYVRSQEQRADDDIVGEVWLGIAKGLPSFTGDATDFRAWAFSIARRRIADHRRSSMRRPAEPTDHLELAAIPGAADPGEEAVATQSAQDAVDRIVRLLPPDHAEVVLLRVLGDLDAEQVGAMLGRSAGWVRVTQHRALRRLAERLGSGVTR